MVKKSQINQVFVFAFSLIIIGFSVFIVGKFVFDFNKTIDDVIDIKIYDEFDKDFESIYREYGSQITKNYKVSEKAEIICFFENSCDLNTYNNEGGLYFDIKRFPELTPNSGGDIIDNLNNFKELNSNIIFFDSNYEVLSYYNLKNFKGCFCARVNSGRFSLKYENYKNKVYISENVIIGN